MIKPSKSLSTSLKGPFGLAPMLTATNFASRLWFSQTSSPDFAIAPFLRVTKSDDIKKIPLIYAPEIFDVKDDVTYPLIPQLMVNRVEDFLRFAEYFLKFTDHVDLNCGCPAPTSVFRGGGSSLLQSSEKFRTFIETLIKELGPEKISVKMRIGFEREAEFPVLLRAISSLPLAHLTIHGRTSKENYTGNARWALVESAQAQVKYQIIGSGDIFSFNKLEVIRRTAPSINSFLIGRGILRNPWIFQELRTSKNETLSFDCLVFSLACFGLLQMLQHEDHKMLLKAVKKGFFLRFCGTDLSAWKKLYYDLVTLARGCPMTITDFETGTTGLSFVKMIWSKISSSLPSHFLSRKPLHSKSFSEFLENLRKLDQESSKDSSDCYTLSYKPELDALFAPQSDLKK